MPARTPEEAVEGFLEPVRQLVLCVSERPLLASGYRPSRLPHVVSFAPRGEPAPLRLRSGLVGLALRVALRYEIVESSVPTQWTARPLGYSYDVLDREGRELVAYHWHPFGVGPSFSHLHVTSRIGEFPLGTGLPSVDLGAVHLPTRRIGLAAVVFLLVAELGVAPLRTDWQQRVSAELGETD